MKILFVSSSPLEYNCSANMRNNALLLGLYKNGHDIYTLTPEVQNDFVDYDDKLKNDFFKKKYYIPLGTIHSKITVKKGKKTFINNLKLFVYKTLRKMRVYDFKASLKNKIADVEIDESFDIVISSSDPKSSHLLAESLIKQNKKITKKWIQYWGDPFAIDINNHSYLPRFVFKKEEKRLISLCDKVVYVSPFTLSKQQELYPKYKYKMTFEPIPYLKTKIYEKKINKEFTIGYFGDYYTKDRNIINIYNVCKSNNYKLLVTGNSDLHFENTDKITFYGRMKKEVVEKFESECDVLVCICNKQGTQLPGKIYHYAATNKAILIILDGDYSSKIKDYLNGFNRFYFCENNVDSINQKIDEILNEKKDFEPVKELFCKEISKKIIK